MRIFLVRQGKKYSEDYVKLLKSQLIGHEVLVLGDQQDADIRLSHNLKGWWSKIELFSPELEKYRPFLYIDLDSYVLGPIPEFPDKFLMCREWWPGSFAKAQSSVMFIPKHVDIFKYFKPNDIHTKGGDQVWLQDYAEGFIQDYFPDLVGSYKLSNKEAPVNTIVTFHGRPKPPESEGWAKEIWMRRYS